MKNCTDLSKNDVPPVHFKVSKSLKTKKNTPFWDPFSFWLIAAVKDWGIDFQDVAPPLLDKGYRLVPKLCL